jgi:hypothetical protein
MDESIKYVGGFEVSEVDIIELDEVNLFEISFEDKVG